MKVSEYLKVSKERISTPENWCQNHSALTGLGKAVTPKNVLAKSWCLLGTLECSSNLLCSDYPIQYIMKANPGIKSGGLAAWNDTVGRKHSEVMEVFDRAIALAEQDGV